MQKTLEFTDLSAWKKSHQLVLMIYRCTALFPNHELFGLVSQMSRSAVSISSNIAEGYGRRTLREKIHFYFISAGSLTELQNQLLISRDIGYLKEAEHLQFYNLSLDVYRLLNGLIRSLRSHT